MREELIAVGDVFLTPREVQVLRLAAEGLTNREIAQRIAYSEKHVEHMLSNGKDTRALYPRLGVTTRAQAVAWYVDRLGLPDGNVNPCSADADVLPEILISSPYFVDTFAYQLETIRQVRMRGDPYFARSLALTLSNRLKSITGKISSSKSSRPLFRIRAFALLEVVEANNELFLSGDVLSGAWPIINEVKEIAQHQNDVELLALGDLCLGDAHYIAKKYADSIDLISEVLDLVKDPGRHLLALRVLALNSAYLDNRSQFDLFETKIARFIEQAKCMDLGRICLTLEGVGRGWGILGQDKAFKVFETAYTVYTQMKIRHEFVPFRAVQLTRSQLEASEHLGTIDEGLRVGVGVPGLLLAREHAYKRHERRIDQLLNRNPH